MPFFPFLTTRQGPSNMYEGVSKSFRTGRLERELQMVQLSLGNRDSSVNIASGYELDDRMIGVRFPAGAGNFSLRHRVQTGPGAHPAFYLSNGYRGLFPWGGKVAGA
jgi:hypothetical protein